MFAPADDPMAMPDPSDVRQRMQQWRAAHPRATLREIEAEADQQVARFRAALVAEATRAGAEETRPDCPDCGRPMRRAGRRRRTVTTTHHEVVSIEGARYRCRVCQTELFPPG